MRKQNANSGRSLISHLQLTFRKHSLSNFYQTYPWGNFLIKKIFWQDFHFWYISKFLNQGENWKKLNISNLSWNFFKLFYPQISFIVTKKLLQFGLLNFNTKIFFSIFRIFQNSWNLHLLIKNLHFTLYLNKNNIFIISINDLDMKILIAAKFDQKKFSAFIKYRANEFCRLKQYLW